MVRVSPWLSTLRSLAMEVVTLVLVWYLLACPRGAAVPLDSLVLGCSCLHVRSPVSGQVCGLPHSMIVALLSLLWVGLLLALVRGLCLRLTLWAPACVGPPICPAFSRVGTAPSTWVPLLWTWLMGEASSVSLLLCLPSECGHSLGSIVSFVTIDRQRRFPLEVVSFAM